MKGLSPILATKIELLGSSVGYIPHLYSLTTLLHIISNMFLFFFLIFIFSVFTSRIVCLNIMSNAKMKGDQTQNNKMHVIMEQQMHTQNNSDKKAEQYHKIHTMTWI